MRIMITGSNRGIGLEYVRQLLARGDQVFAACRNPESAQELQTLKDQYASQLSIIKMEVSDESSVSAAYEEVSKQVDALDIIINNAAINPGDESLDDIKKSVLMQTFEVNVAGVMTVTQQFIPLLQQDDNPRLVNISSGVASLARGGAGKLYSYNISKTALNMLNLMLHKDLQPMGVITLSMSPGWVKTDMGGDGAQLEPEYSIRHQLQVIDGLTPEDSGRFVDFDGEDIPW